MLKQVAALFGALLFSCAAIAAEKKPFYGDLHLHTGFSFDAWAAMGTRTTPDDAYRFARGETVDWQGRRVRRRDPLDFLAVTDHAEFMGVMNQLEDPNSPLSRNEIGRSFQANRATLFNTMFALIFQNRPVPEGLNAPAAMASAWARQIEAANANYRPGKFTTLIGYEWTAQVTSGAYNLHRNVIFNSDRAPLPFSSVDSSRPEDLWTWLDVLKDQGVEAIAIPHNSNGSGGLMFDWLMGDGRPIDAAYARRRAAHEPLIELVQNKGQSETTPSLSPNDEFANFEVYDYLIVEGRNGVRSFVQGSYARQALGRGLVLGERLGANPFRFGFVGGTDFHNGLSTSREDAYAGGIFGIDPETTQPDRETARRVLSPNPIAGAPPDAAWSSGGLTGVWAEENTRPAIFAALKRRESFATSGTRLRVRLFGGWSFPATPFARSNWPDAAQRTGVTMGSDLPARPAGAAAPRFLLWAAKDPEGADLERLQIIKVWAKAGDAQEKIFDVVRAGANPKKTGAAELTADWSDPEFDPALPAVYYLRALEMPTPRWSALLAGRYSLPPASGVPASIQERGWTSPIWYTPAR